ncbi:MAG: integrase [Firmicutes bacterium]|nr:integrase [Bacillota bacterium]
MTQQTLFDTAGTEPQPEEQIRIDPVTGKEDEFHQDDTFSYAGYQITREEFFAHAREPSLCLCGNELYVNKVCLNKAPDTTRVLIMVNAVQKKIVLKPCDEEIKDSVLWKTAKGNVRHIKCKPAFCSLISTLTSWDLNNRYKMIGKLVRSQGERLLIFDLDAALIYPRKPVMDAAGKVVKSNIDREPVYMESWRHQFGLPVEEHERTYAINRFDDYVVISVQKQPGQRQAHPQLDREDTIL